MGSMPGFVHPAFGKRITRWFLFAKELMIDLDSSKFFYRQENWNTFVSLMSILISVDKCVSIKSLLVTWSTMSLNHVNMVDAVGTGVRGVQNRRLHLNVQHLVFHGQSLLKYADASVLLISQAH